MHSSVLARDARKGTHVIDWVQWMHLLPDAVPTVCREAAETEACC